jgi:hypothetical protein
MLLSLCRIQYGKFINRVTWPLLLLFFPVIVQGQKDSISTLPTTKYVNTLPKPGLVRGPYLQVATSESIQIRWRTDALSRSRVRYGEQLGQLDKFADDSALVTEHKVLLTGLRPSTKYYYSIGSLNDTLQGDRDNYFITLPVAGQEGFYRIGVFGDCGTNTIVQRSVRDQFIKYLGNNELDAWILLGDNAYENGTDAQFQQNFFNVYKNDLLKHYPLFPAPGNHDYGNVDFRATAVPERMYELAYYQNFTMPVNGESGGLASHNPAYYSFDLGNIHFLSLDSYGKEENAYRLYDTLSPQVQWVKKDLEANQNKGWLVVFWHHPPYSMGSHNSDKQSELVKIRQNFLRILERYGVDLVLCGHSHDYERSKLMKGYYGMEADFNAERHNLSSSSGFYDGSNNSCPYVKDSVNDGGIVYVVSGSAGKLDEMSQEEFPHNAMPYSNNQIGGASILEVRGNRLDLKWICADGVIRDQFTMMKNVNKNTVLNIKRGQSVTLTASFTGKYQWNYKQLKTRSIMLTPPAGKSTYIVQDEFSCIKDVFHVNVKK